jgi:glycosyltransferase involved in cell wall biosynthesis
MTAALAICVLTYNRSALLAECVRSLQRACAGIDVEIIVLDNASTEDYSAVLNALGPDIRHDRCAVNVGFAGNFQRAIEMIRGFELGMVFHDDDLATHDLVRVEMEMMRSHQELVFVGATARAFSGSPPPDVASAVSRRTVYWERARLAVDLVEGLPLHIGSLMYRTCALPALDVNDYGCGIIADRAFLLALAARGPVAVVDGPHVLYRRHAAQDSQSGLVTEDQVLALGDHYLAAVSEGGSPELLQRFQRAWVPLLLELAGWVRRGGRANALRMWRRARSTGQVDRFYWSVRSGEALINLAGLGWLTYAWHPRRLTARARGRLRSGR